MSTENTWLRTANMLEDAGAVFKLLLLEGHLHLSMGVNTSTIVRIKLNSKNQAGPAWMSFLR